MTPVHYSLQSQNTLQQFIQECDAILQDLSSARSMETMDALTSNYSLVGSLISCFSSSQNHTVAARVNQLQQQAYRINEMLHHSGMFKQGIGFPLSTDFSGSGISRAENEEHSFFGNLLTNGGYSSYASYGTMHELSTTSSKIQHVRNQALQLQYALNGSMPYRFTRF